MTGESKGLIDSLSKYFTPTNKRQSRVAQISFLSRANFTQDTSSTEEDSEDDDEEKSATDRDRRSSRDRISTVLDDKPSTSSDQGRSSAIDKKRQKLAERRSEASAKARTSQAGSLLDGLSHRYATGDESRKRAAPGSYLDLVKGAAVASRSRSNSQPRSPSMMSSGLSGDEIRRRQKVNDRGHGDEATTSAIPTGNESTTKRAKATASKGSKKTVKHEPSAHEKVQKRTLDQVDPSRKLDYGMCVRFLLPACLQTTILF